MYPRIHSILLVQTSPSINSRTYSDYESISECVDGVTKLFEDYLKFVNPNLPEIRYELSELLHFIDQLTDLSCLVYEKSANMYIPYNKDWIKQKVYEQVTKEATELEQLDSL